MKFIPLSLLLFGLQTASFAQPYFCDAPDSVLAKYRDDADRMAIEQTFSSGSTWADSVNINPELAQMNLGALIAVYNSVSQARDSVIDVFDIHKFPSIALSSFIVTADSTLPWVQQLSAGVVPTGDAIVDQLLSNYEVESQDVLSWTTFNNKSIVFQTGTNWNIQAVSATFAALPGVLFAEPNWGCCDGSTIKDSVFTDHVQLIYSRGWGDCPAGCTERRFWEFNVGPDCTVDFVGSYGTPIFNPSGIREDETNRPRIWPNPAQRLLHVEAASRTGTFAVFGLDGRSIVSASPYSDGINVSALPSGIYLLRQIDRPEAAPLRFVVAH
jgi:hypothetical protein